MTWPIESRESCSGSIKPRPVSRRAATVMGPGGCAARRLGTLPWRRALSPRAGSAASDGSRLLLLATGRLPARPAVSGPCLTPSRARGLHGGPGLEERAEWAAGERRPEFGTAGTDVEEGGGSALRAARRRVPAEEAPITPVYACLLESQNNLQIPSSKGTSQGVGANFAVSQSRN